MAGRYARALFDLANDANALDAVASDMKSLRSMLAESDDLREMVRSPVYSEEDQQAAMKAVAEKAGFQELTTNFLGLVARNRRLFAVGGMAHVFAELLAKHRGEVTAEVVSAVALTDAQSTELKAALSKSVGKDIQMDTSVDASLLGGLIVKIGSRMIDSSVRTKLNNLQVAMKEVG